MCRTQVYGRFLIYEYGKCDVTNANNSNLWQIFKLGQDGITQYYMVPPQTIYRDLIVGLRNGLNMRSICFHRLEITKLAID